MLTLPSSVKLYVATAPTDLRKSFDGLSTLVQGSFGVSATTGDLFIFLNRRGTQVRILCLGPRRFLRAMLLEGIDAPKVRRPFPRIDACRTTGE
jgi:IS66 Orf2 like protein